MTQIRFRFDPDKMIAVLAYLAERVVDLDAMKSAKLLYFADRGHLRRYGRTILGDAYYGLEHGPVPTATYELIEKVFRNAVDDECATIAEALSEYVDVDRSGERPRLVARKSPDLDELSPSDIEVLDETLDQFGSMSALQLRKLAHQQPEIQYADEQRASQRRGSVPIPLELFLEPETGNEAIDALRDSQEERDFAESLNW